MKCRIEDDFVSGQIKVWLYHSTHDGIRVLRLRDRLCHDWEKYEAYADNVPASLTLPPEALQALVDEASDFLPPSAATDRHLADAVSVRDRLLSLIEREGAPAS